MNDSPDRPRLAKVFGREEISARVRALGADIDRTYGNEPLVAICVLKGAFIFFGDLVRCLRNPNLELDFVRVASYGKNSVSSKHVIFSKDVEVDIRGKHALLVEDIVDSGHTMRFLLDQFAARGPASLRVAALVDKVERREASVNVDFAGFYLEYGFLVGYGMDYAGQYRALPDICEIVADK